MPFNPNTQTEDLNARFSVIDIDQPEVLHFILIKFSQNLKENLILWHEQLKIAAKIGRWKEKDYLNFLYFYTSRQALQLLISEKPENHKEALIILEENYLSPEAYNIAYMNLQKIKMNKGEGLTEYNYRFQHLVKIITAIAKDKREKLRARELLQTYIRDCL